MKQLTIKDIRALKPCYDPGKYLLEDWTGTVLDILNVKACPIPDRFWVALREDFIDAKTLRLFACLCAEDVLTGKSDQRSWKAVKMARQYAKGKATVGSIVGSKVGSIVGSIVGTAQTA